MSDVGGASDRLNPISAALAYTFRNTRPPFHKAVMVLYWSIMVIPIAWAGVLVRWLFGERVTVDYQLIAFFAGPLGLGALASAVYELKRKEHFSPWTSAAIFGGATGLAFSLLVDLKHKSTFNFSQGTLVAGCLALIFLFLRWLMLKEAKQQIE
jgi:hypothetical protein